MDSDHDVTMGDGAVDVHKPFTVEENIQRLNGIDKSITELMHHTATALKSLTLPPSSAQPSGSLAATEAPSDGAAKPSLDAPSQKNAFRSSTDSFLATLHSVDVRLRRQILALEEAGIVNLGNMPGQEPQAGAAKTASLRPNGLGTVGNLDVGWLNSRGARVERDMEAELWGQAKEFLEQNGVKAKP